MKKVLFVFFAILMVMAMVIPCFAEETPTDVDKLIDQAEKELSEAVGAEVNIDKDKYIKEDGTFDYEAFLADLQKELEGAPDDVAGENYWSRLWEFIWAHRSGILSLILTAAFGILGIFVRKWIADVKARQNLMLSKQVATEKATDAQVQGYNEMVKVCDKMNDSLEKKTKEDEARDIEITKCTAVCVASMKMMMAAYTNSRSVPEYVKTAINEAYYDLKKTLGEDDTLLATFEELVNVKVDESEEV